MSNIHKPGQDNENSDASIEAEEDNDESGDIVGSESKGHKSPKGDSDPTIKNH